MTSTPNQTICKLMQENFLFYKIAILSTDDRSFLTHRLPMAMAAKKTCRNVWVVCRDTGKCDEIVQFGFKVARLPVTDSPLNLFANFRMLQTLASIYGEIRADLIYHSSVQMSFLGSLAHFLSSNSPSINAITGLGYLFSSDTSKAKVLRWILSPILRVLWRRQGTVMLFQNPDDRMAFSERGLAEEASPIIPGSGVDDKKFTPVAIKDNLKKSGRPIVIGCACRLIADKGISELLEAIQIVQKKHSIELRIAGDIYPKNPSSFRSQDIAQWSKVSSVYFLGEVSDMVKFWQNCDIAILPSHREGFPKALLEAAACGLPLLGTDVPGIREIVVNGYNGFLFAKADCQDIVNKIEKIVIDHAFRESAGKASRELVRARRLSNADVEEAFVQLFLSIKIRADSASDR